MIKAFCRSILVAFAVVPHADCAICESEQSGNDGSYHNDNKSWLVARCILSLEDQRTNKVACETKKGQLINDQIAKVTRLLKGMDVRWTADCDIPKQ